MVGGITRMLSGIAASALRMQPKGWQKLRPKRIAPGDRVRLPAMPDYTGTTGVVCYVGVSHRDTMHIRLDTEQLRRTRHCKRSDIVGWAPADPASMATLDCILAGNFGWTPLMRDG